MDDYRREYAERRKAIKRKKSRRKNLIILIETVIILILTVSLIAVSVSYAHFAAKYGKSDASGSLSGASDSASDSSYTASQLQMIAETEKWYLKLVNLDHTVDNDFINNVDLANIDERFSSGTESSKYMDSRVVDYFNRMCQAALSDGISLISVSSYRTYSYQNTLYNNRVQRCINEGYNEEEAKQVAATIVALPGTSEHHTGFAVDINSVEESFENTRAFAWLQEHAAEYGFIMRYPKDKQNITKIIYEPWHYRYVGAEHAKAMNELGMCMEEYIDYLSSGGTEK